MKIALYGGAFDPPHVCHLLSAAYVMAVHPLDELWLVPTFQHPFGKSTVSFQDRVAMCERLVAQLGPKAKVSLAEQEIQGQGKTLFLLQHLQKRYPEHQFALVIGADNYRDRHLWHGFEEIERLAEIWVIGRGGVQLAQETINLPDVSSTEIRRRLTAHESIAHLVPLAIADYIEAHQLYR